MPGRAAAPMRPALPAGGAPHLPPPRPHGPHTCATYALRSKPCSRASCSMAAAGEGSTRPGVKRLGVGSSSPPSPSPPSSQSSHSCSAPPRVAGQNASPASPPASLSLLLLSMGAQVTRTPAATPAQAVARHHARSCMRLRSLACACSGGRAAMCPASRTHARSRAHSCALAALHSRGDGGAADAAIWEWGARSRHVSL